MKSIAAEEICVAYLQRKKSGGFTLFEFCVVAALLAVLLTVLAQRLVFYQEQAERVAVETTVSNMRTGLYSTVAHLYMSNRDAEVAALAGRNPVIWLDRKPPNYQGEYDAPGPAEVIPGSWYFDRTRQYLVYIFAKGKSFSSAASERLYFKVKLQHSPSGNNDSPSAAAGKTNVVLIQVTE
jgi:general secretion pathway protein G